MELTEYQQRFGGRDDAAPGWDAIQQRLNELYHDQEPKHWGTVIKHMLGGPDPLDGISVYQNTAGGMPHLHFCTFGFTSLYYDESAVGGEFSRFGFELTFRLASPLPPSEDHIWACNLLQSLARYVFKSGKWFSAYHWIPANGPIRADFATDIVGLVFLDDPQLNPIESPHGRVEFIQMFGITQAELDRIQSNSQSCEQLIEHHRRQNPLLVTDLARKNELTSPAAPT
jgi:hypothetical protein